MAGPKELEAWFDSAHRDLPWRRTQDPYRIWVSEVMLQQTQVATVIPYYERFLKTLPTLETLAEAKEDTVLSLWSGLGYYSRARNLQKGARYLLTHHQGKFPQDREELLATPGIGPYTAGAILSIAFNLPIPLVDGNVQRVFSRYFGWREEIETKSSQNFFWEKASLWVTQSQNPRSLNQAIMELGATVCTKTTPACSTCPLQTGCEANRLGLTEKLPARKKKREKIDLYWLSVRYQHGGEIFLKRNGKEEWWEEMWDLPRADFKKPKELEETVDRFLLHPKLPAERLGIRKHTVTHHRITVTALKVELRRKKDLPPELAEGRWFPLSQISKLPISSLARKVLVLE